MKLHRRDFFRVAGVAAAGSLLPLPIEAAGTGEPSGEAYGCLVDLTRCIGCRKCEQACNVVQHLPAPERSFDDLLVLDTKRRMSARAFTVVNRYHAGTVDEHGKPIPTYVKQQCMHCLSPACVSACPVGALTKKSNGAVHYDVSRCIGCRYCMVACPFQVPAYEYEDPLTPRVRKCTFCIDERLSQGKIPGCMGVCPVEALTFGRRDQLLATARKRIQDDPGRYIQHIYGEREVGGTSWLYLSGTSFDRLGFQKLPHQAMPKLPETIQHGLYSYLWAPAVLFAALGGVMKLMDRSAPAETTADHKEGR
ncbi:MAG: hydrogenase 2 operon protein HybA [Syntrophobacteraceae bacterium]